MRCHVGATNLIAVVALTGCVVVTGSEGNGANPDAGSAAGGSTGPIGTGGTGPISWPQGGTGGAPAGGPVGYPDGSAGADTGSVSLPQSGAGVNDGGYVVSGNWHGYAWTTAVGAGSTINPADFSAVLAGSSLCASGSVAPLADFSGMAALGINLNQAELPPNPPAAVTPTGDGIVVGINNKLGTALRIQIQGPNGSTDANDRWCAPVSGKGGLVPWTAFNTKCWDNTGAAYAKQPLQSAMVLVPGGNKPAVQYDFCITGLFPSDAAPPTAGGPVATPDAGAVSQFGAGTTCAQYGKLSVARNNVPYIVTNNAWGGADETQCIDVNGTSFTVTRQNGTGNTSGAPVSYPSVIYGRKDSSSTSASSALPAALSSLKSVTTGISSNADGSVAGVYNASYDIWLNADASPTDAPTGAYVMVWLYQPSGARPAGSLKATVTIGGTAFNVWSGGTGANGKPYIAYVVQKPTPALSFEVLDFIKDATTRGVVQNSWYLTNVQAGFEIWSGGKGLQMRDFWVDAKK
jgi:hypothetical protein